MPTTLLEPPVRQAPPRQSGTRRTQRLLAAAMPLLLMAAVLLVYGIRYTTNDDATLANIAAGAYGPDRIHLVYVNVLFGCLLRPLYLLAGGVNWYVVVQLVLAAACGVCLCRLALERLGAARGSCLFWMVALPFSVYLIYRFQYVKNSGLCLMTGLLLLADTLGRPNRRTVLGVFFVLMGCLLRWDNFYAIGGLSAAMLLGRFLRLRREEKFRAAATMAAMFAVVFSAKAADVLAYRLDDGWRAFTEYNAARTQFSDYKAQRLPEENVFAAEGISDNDYEMLLRWDFYDGTVFPAQRIEALAGQIPGKTAGRVIRDTLKTCLGLLTNRSYRYVFALLVLAGLVLLKWNRKALPFWGTMAMLGLLVLYLEARDRFPSYVEIPLLLAAILFGIDGIAQGECRAAPGPRSFAAALVLLAALTLPTLKAVYTSSVEYREWAGMEQGYFESMSQDKEHLYLLSTESINVAAGLDVWHPRPEGFFSNILAYGGWLSHAPHREQVLAAYGLSDPLTDAVDNERVYLSYHGIDTAAVYASEHLGTPVEAVECGPNAFAPYQLRTAAQTP